MRGLGRTVLPVLTTLMAPHVAALEQTHRVQVSPVAGGQVDGAMIERQALAQSWSLSAAELDQLALARLQMAPFVDPNISPLELLGMSASSAGEKRYYARRFVEAQRAHQVRALEWAAYVQQAAASAASEDSLRSNPMIAHTLDAERSRLRGVQRERLGFAQSATARSPFGQRLAESTLAKRGVLFVASDCGRCPAAFDQAMNEVRTGKATGVDVVFVDDVDRRAISRWAVSAGITQGDVESRRVTLNVESQRWASIRGANPVPFTAWGEM